MSKIKLTEKEVRILKKQFADLVYETVGDKEKTKEGMKDKSSLIYRNFSLQSDAGKVLYKKFSDKELICILKNAADAVQHSPSQNEILWVFKDYLKLRFKKWPYALEKAGLSKCAGNGGKSYEQSVIDEELRKVVLKELREETMREGHIPHPRHVPKLAKKVKKFYATWGEALEDAGIDAEKLACETVYKIDDLEKQYFPLLAEVKSEAEKLGRAPMHTEICEKTKLPLLERCGSWRNVLYQINLEPVVRIRPYSSYYLGSRRENNRTAHSQNLRNCYFKLINPDKAVVSDLEELEGMMRQEGRILTKTDVSQPMRKRLIAACESWNNVLFQLGIKTNHDFDHAGGDIQ